MSFPLQGQLSSQAGQELASIIIPNYNHAAFIAEAIQSVLQQDYPHYEVIVVDDGSTDNSRQVVAQFGERVRYIWQENQGLSAARNTGIRASTGSVIGVLDADDLYEPTFLSAMLAVLQANPAADGVYCGYQFVDQDNKPLPQIERRLIPETGLFRALLDGNFLVPESMLLRRHCYEQAGEFDPALSACEDWDMWLRVSRRFEIVNTTQVLTRHRILPGSMSTDPVRMLNNRLAVLRKHIGPEPAGDEPEAGLKRRAYGRAYLASGVEYLQYGDREGADRCLLKLAAVSPELLTQLDTLYQLACGDQPKGAMGDFDSLDLQRNARVLLDMLDKLFDSPPINRKVQPIRRQAYARAYFALGLLAYGARQIPAARRFLNSALKNDLRSGLERRFLAVWLKTFLGAGFIDRLKDARRNILSAR